MPHGTRPRLPSARVGELSRSQVAVYAAVALVVVLLGARYLRGAGDPPEAAPGGSGASVSVSEDRPRGATVHVAGAAG